LVAVAALHPLHTVMPLDQVFIGVLTAVLCGAGIVRRRWLIEHTRKGRWLAERWGAAQAERVLVAILLCGVALGVLLALGVINPVRW
jgi:hypothetical protein